MNAYVIEVRHQPVGPAPAKAERVYVMCESEADALLLARKNLDLIGDENLAVMRKALDAEWKALGLKPYQVRRA